MKRPIRLRKDIRAQMHDLLLLRATYQRLAAEQDARLASLLRVAYGIDIEREHWTLDEARGVLTPGKE